MCSADLTKDGMKDIMVGRDDGTVEVWGFDGGGGRPKLIFERSLQESVTSIESGLVTNGNYKLTLTHPYPNSYPDPNPNPNPNPNPKPHPDRNLTLTLARQLRRGGPLDLLGQAARLLVRAEQLEQRRGGGAAAR